MHPDRAALLARDGETNGSTDRDQDNDTIMDTESEARGPINGNGHWHGVNRQSDRVNDSRRRVEGHWLDYGSPLHANGHDRHVNYHHGIHNDNSHSASSTKSVYKTIAWRLVPFGMPFHKGVAIETCIREISKCTDFILEAAPTDLDMFSEQLVSDSVRTADSSSRFYLRERHRFLRRSTDCDSDYGNLSDCWETRKWKKVIWSLQTGLAEYLEADGLDELRLSDYMEGVLAIHRPAKNLVEPNNWVSM